MSTKSSKAIKITALFLAVLLLVSCFSGALAVTQSQINALKQQQAALNEQKKAAADKLNAAGAEINDLAAKKTALDEENNLTMQEIELINEQIDLYEKLVEEKTKELEEAKQTEEKQKVELSQRMCAMEENGTLSYISILFKATSFTDFLSRLADIGTMMENDKALEQAYVAARENVEKVKAEYEQTLADQKDTKQQLEDKKAELEQQIADAVEVIKALELDYEAYKAQYEAVENNAANLNAQINDAIAQLAAQQQQQGGVVTGTGSYIWPLPGYTGQHTFGNRYHPILNYWRMHYGEDISAPAGTPILAADSGTVVTVAYEAGGYGNYVVLSHGDGRSTRYAHMSATAVKVGQTVTQGATIGYVGSTGLSTGAHLHFETRVNGTAVDPYTYF